MIYDEQSRDDARAQFAERRLQKLDALWNSGEPHTAPHTEEPRAHLELIETRPVRLRWTAQGELFQGDE